MLSAKFIEGKSVIFSETLTHFGMISTQVYMIKVSEGLKIYDSLVMYKSSAKFMMARYSPKTTSSQPLTRFHAAIRHNTFMHNSCFLFCHAVKVDILAATGRKKYAHQENPTFWGYLNFQNILLFPCPALRTVTIKENEGSVRIQKSECRMFGTKTIT